MAALDLGTLRLISSWNLVESPVADDDDATETRRQFRENLLGGKLADDRLGLPWPGELLDLLACLRACTLKDLLACCGMGFCGKTWVLVASGFVA